MAINVNQAHRAEMLEGLEGFRTNALYGGNRNSLLARVEEVAHFNSIIASVRANPLIEIPEFPTIKQYAQALGQVVSARYFNR